MLSCGTHVTSHVALASMCVRVHHQSRRSPRLTGRNAKRPSVLPPNFGTRTRENRFTRSAVVSAPIHLGRIKASKASASFLEVSAHVRQRGSPYALRKKITPLRSGCLGYGKEKNAKQEKNSKYVSLFAHMGLVGEGVQYFWRVLSRYGGFVFFISSFVLFYYFYFCLQRVRSSARLGALARTRSSRRPAKMTGRWNNLGQR